jgi:hypothetical protein
MISFLFDKLPKKISKCSRKNKKGPSPKSPKGIMISFLFDKLPKKISKCSRKNKKGPSPKSPKGIMISFLFDKLPKKNIKMFLHLFSFTPFRIKKREGVLMGPPDPSRGNR